MGEQGGTASSGSGGHLLSLPPLDAPLNHDTHSWKVIEDNFLMVISC